MFKALGPGHEGVMQASGWFLFWVGKWGTTGSYKLWFKFILIKFIFSIYCRCSLVYYHSSNWKWNGGTLPCLTLLRQHGSGFLVYVAQSWDTQRKVYNLVWCPEKLGNFTSVTEKVIAINAIIKGYGKVIFFLVLLWIIS